MRAPTLLRIAQILATTAGLALVMGAYASDEHGHGGEHGAKAEKPDKAAKAEKAEKGDKADKAEKSDKGACCAPRRAACPWPSCAT